jgi:molybdopterin-dependent oxidoreductase alpha subunit
MTEITGGGSKKILYTLGKIRRIGFGRAARALRAKNTCKACAYGMGGQKGGMTNELGEFPAICNKSVQAQSTDIQPSIPVDIFNHSLHDFQALSAKELEQLGRLNHPILRKAGENKFRTLSWEQAITHAVSRFSNAVPDRTFFYASGRSSNEAAFLFQLLARAYGTNNVHNCSFLCHQASGVGLTNIIGSGTTTIALADLPKSDLIFVIGANPASNHPRFVQQLKACRDRGGEVIVINPIKEAGLVKFALPKDPGSMLSGGSAIASFYIQPHIGSDLALFTAIAKQIVEQGDEDKDFLQNHTENYKAFRFFLEKQSWPELLKLCGISREEITKTAQIFCKANNVIFAWGMGVTHHENGTEIVEAIAHLALLRGQIGRPGAGLLPLRGHSNVQGIGTVGVKPGLSSQLTEALAQYYDIAIPKKPGLDTMACIDAAARGEMDAALFMGGNLLQACPSRERAEKAISNIPFRLCLTTTLNKSHIFGDGHEEVLILPVTARDEEWQSTTQESMFNFVRLSDGGIARHKNTRPETHILADIASGLLPDCVIDFNTFKQHNTARAAIAALIPGMEALENINETKEEFHIKGRVLHKRHFNTANHKARFSPPQQISPIRAEAPFMLTTARSEGQFNSIIYEEQDLYRGIDQRWAVMMNGEDIKNQNLQIGNLIDLYSQSGAMRRVKVYAGQIPPGNLMAYYPEANCLTDETRDPRSHTPAFKSTPVWLKSPQSGK